MKKSLSLVLLAVAASASGGDRLLRTEMVLDAPVAEVFRAWTTEEGVKSFFAPGAHIDLKVDGLYEIYFQPTAEPGHRGAEGMRILALEPDRRFAFTWSAPHDQPYVRGQRTMVVLDFDSLGPARTHLRFSQVGWGEGPEWDAAFQYFDRVWNQFVLPNLKYRFQKGPIDWNAPPHLAPIAASLRNELVSR
jgi:uncharacterized protein YndB with AHSA1/START domain